MICRRRKEIFNVSDYKVEVIEAVKSFKETIALNNVSLRFETGKIHGIIGRNGSGKTVLFKCICGFMSLTGGEIMIDGVRLKPYQMQNIGIIIEEPGFISSMSGYDNLRYLAAVSNKISSEKIRETLLQVGLSPTDKKKVGKYSMGMRQRLGLAQAIMEDPPLLVLDEPMNGLDNRGVQDIRELLMQQRAEGKTILLTSHNKEDIECLCDTVHEMDNGKIIA
jgi:ABC-2 type transport system ATP-binding protein